MPTEVFLDLLKRQGAKVVFPVRCPRCYLLTAPCPSIGVRSSVEDLLAQYAEKQISDKDFRHKRSLPNGWQLNTKEELMYHRVSREHFGELGGLSWMGRTKVAPKQ